VGRNGGVSRSIKDFRLSVDDYVLPGKLSFKNPEKVAGAYYIAH